MKKIHVYWKTIGDILKTLDCLATYGVNLFEVQTEHFPIFQQFLLNLIFPIA